MSLIQKKRNWRVWLIRSRVQRFSCCRRFSLIIIASSFPAVLAAIKSLSFPSMPPPTIRLVGKQRWPRLGSKQKAPIRKRSKRAVHVQEGLAPKARRPFALFVQESNAVPKGSSKEAFALEMRRLGKLWKNLPQNEKKKYQELCSEEFATQRTTLKANGICVRKRQCKALLRIDAKKFQPSQPSAASAQVGPTMFGSKFKPIADPNNPQLCTVLGEGSYGCVLLCRGAHCGRRFAVKVYKGKTALEEIQWEATLLMQLREQAQGSLEDWFPSVCASHPEAKPFPFMAMVYWGCSLQSFLQRAGPQNSGTLEEISLQLKAALRQLHKFGVVHLDVKPANILWAESAALLKLTDFGMSEFWDVVSPASQHVLKPRFREYVTALYRPPELWDASYMDLCKHLKPSADLWSYGCVIFECATGLQLMAPSKSNRRGSCKFTIQSWCQSWKSLVQGTAQKACCHSIEHRMFLRLILAAETKQVILLACAPEPLARKWLHP